MTHPRATWSLLSCLLLLVGSAMAQVPPPATTQTTPLPTATTAPGTWQTPPPLTEGTPAPRSVEESLDPLTERLIEEIDADAQTQLPLYGQDMFREALIQAATEAAAGPAVVAQPSPNFIIGPGDRVNITFYNALVEPRTVDVTVTSDGNVAFDPVGIVAVSGLSVAEFQERLTRLIQLRGPRDATVQYSFIDLHTVTVRVTGEVRRPASRVILSGYATLLDALAQSGGPTAYGSLRHIILTRGTQRTEIDLYSYLQQGETAANPPLRDGDAIHVPLATRLVAVAGEVKRPARYELVNEQTVREALGLAGNLTARAARLQVQRITDFDNKVLIDLDPRAVLAGTADLTAVEPLRDGDTLSLRTASDEAREAVVVQGGVGRPGEFGHHPGLTLGEALQLAQGVQRDSWGGVGNIRRMTSDGRFASLNFTIAEAISGGEAANLPLESGDVIHIPTLDEESVLVVSVRGGVVSPNRYQTRRAMTVGDLLALAGGLAAGADAQRALLISSEGGERTSTTIDLSPTLDGGQPVPNPMLRNGDELSVPFIATMRVRVSGQVREPGSFTLTAGLTVKDLLERANGLLPRAVPRAELQRLIPESAEIEKVFIDLEAAQAGEPTDDLPLREGDHLIVFSVDNYVTFSEPIVSVQGAVQRPGPRTRSRGMRVSDVIREAGLRPEADRDRGTIIRRTPGGLNQLLRFSPTLAMAGTGPDNPELADGDLIEFPALMELTVRPATASVSGAVYRPGPVVLAENMTVDDLILRAGGFLPEAFAQRVILRRRTANDTLVDLPLDLRVPVNMPVQRDDQLMVMTWDQTRFRDSTVRIIGDVQRPGEYERTDGLTVSGLLFMAGGLLRPPQVTTVEIARPTQDAVVAIRPNTTALLAGDATQDVRLEDRDRIYVRATPPEPVRDVLVKGEVRSEGFYPILEVGDTLSTLVRRVGLRPDTAFLGGAVLLRRVDQITEPQVARYASEIYRVLADQQQRRDIATVLSTGTVDTTPEVLERITGSRATLPSDAVTDTYTDLFEERGRDLLSTDIDVTLQARENLEGSVFTIPDTLRRYVRVPVDLAAELEGTSTIGIRPSDIIVIPRIPETIMVQGEVNSNMAQIFVPGDRVGDYIRRAGGTRPNADPKTMLLVRANGVVENARLSTEVHRGDILMVQAKPLRPPLRPQSIWEQMQALGSILGGLATTILAVNNAIK